MTYKGRALTSLIIMLNYQKTEFFLIKFLQGAANTKKANLEILVHDLLTNSAYWPCT